MKLPPIGHGVLASVGFPFLLPSLYPYPNKVNLGEKFKQKRNDLQEVAIGKKAIGTLVILSKGPLLQPSRIKQAPRDKHIRYVACEGTCPQAVHFLVCKALLHVYPPAYKMMAFLYQDNISHMRALDK